MEKIKSSEEELNPLLANQREQSVGEYIRSYMRRLGSGDLGSLPIIIGIIVIAIIFQTQNSNFLTPRNFVSLILQMSGWAMIAYGVVFVLLLGEIDLSIGYVSAVGGVSVAILLKNPNVLEIVEQADLARAAGEPVSELASAGPVVIFMFLRQWSMILFPLILGGARYLWYYLHRSPESKNQERVLIETAIFAVIGFLMSLLFTGTEDLVWYNAVAGFLIPGGGEFIVNGWEWYNAMAVALIITASIGLLQGSIITLFRVPSFIVTLAGLMAWNGVVLRIIGRGGTVIIQNKTINDIANSYLPEIEKATEELSIGGLNLGFPTLSWGLIVLLMFVAGFVLIQIFQYITRAGQGLSNRPIPIIIAQTVFLVIIAVLVAHIADQDRGVPFVGLILLVFLVVLSFVANNTQFGRFVYAVGGNPEAARRAGISVTKIRIYVFIMSSMLAGFGGFILASRLRSVDTGAGGGNLLLNAIAAAVIGGTSLFGGRGHVSSAVLGALIIASIENGMSLLNLASGDKFIITGTVLLIAVVVDSLSRRRQQQSGIA